MAFFPLHSSFAKISYLSAHHTRHSWMLAVRTSILSQGQDQICSRSENNKDRGLDGLNPFLGSESVGVPRRSGRCLNDQNIWSWILSEMNFFLYFLVNDQMLWSLPGFFFPFTPFCSNIIIRQFSAESSMILSKLSHLLWNRPDYDAILWQRGSVVWDSSARRKKKEARYYFLIPRNRWVKLQQIAWISSNNCSGTWVNID